jgi:serine/threonine protein phosphatase PrpC
LKKNLPKNVLQFFDNKGTSPNHNLMTRALENGILTTHEQIVSCDFDVNLSGSTCITVVISKTRKLWCANVGDSRAVVAK